MTISNHSVEKEKVELLLPAQNMKSVKAVKGIADAVYFGTDALNMRMNADNFPLSQLDEIVEEIHGYCNLPMLVGDFFYIEDSKIIIPEGKHICLWALQSMMPIFPILTVKNKVNTLPFLKLKLPSFNSSSQLKLKKLL